MKTIAAGLVVSAVLVAGAAQASERKSQVAQAEEHLRKACEVVWTLDKPHEVDQCTERALAALSDQNRLRDNQLKRFLYESEQELKSCKTELAQFRINLARHEASRAPR